jgi:transcriptional regulator GlxA family with amidase domain
VNRSGKKEQVQARTRRVLFIAAPGTEILDLVGPLQVFARAAEMFGKQNLHSPPIYAVEVITTSPRASVVTNCGLRIAAHNTFRRVRGEIDTLLIAGGSAIEKDEIDIEVVQWIRKVSKRIRRIGSVCTGAMLLARAGLLDGRKAATHWRWCELLARISAGQR